MSNLIEIEMDFAIIGHPTIILNLELEFRSVTFLRRFVVLDYVTTIFRFF